MTTTFHGAPLVTTGLYHLTGPTGSAIYVKNETEQITAAFKYRGVRALLLQDSGRGSVVTASTGNHGAAVAEMARRTGRRAVVFVPSDTPKAKMARIVAGNAELLLIDSDYAGCAAAAQTWAARHDATYVPSFDHPLIIGGHTSLFAEAIEQLGTMPSSVYVPVGGGGLLAAALLSFDRATTKVIGVELAGAAAMCLSLEAGERLTIDVPRGVAEGLCVRQVGALPYRIAQAFQAQIETATADELGDAVADLWHQAGIRAELAGAAAFAAARRASVRFEPTLAVVSGGNIDDALFDRLTRVAGISRPAAA